MKFWIDFKYALRLLMKKPSFTALTVGVMACGLGICLYMFTFINVVMFKPLDFNNGERMVVVDIDINGVLHNGGQVKYINYQDVKQQSSSFSMLGAMQRGIVTVSGGEVAASYNAVYAQPELFTYTATLPIKGRLFNQNDDIPGANLVAVIGYELWQNYFIGRQDIVGQTVEVDGKKTEIIGVMPQGYLFPRASQLWLPIQFDPSQYTRAQSPQVTVYGLLKPGVSATQANSEMRQIMKRVNQQYPEFNKDESLVANTFMASIMGARSEPMMMIMMVAVGLVLLLACTNVANLLYARSNERAKETAIRVALGAPQSRLVMQMLWESLIICSIGGVFALLMAAWALETTNHILPTFINGRAPFWWNIQLDGSLILTTIALTLLTALFTGLLPALKIIKGDFNAVLRDGTRGAPSRKAKKTSQFLVVFEVALSICLLTAASMMTVAVKMANNIDYGAKTTNMLTAQIALPEASYDTAEKRIQYFQTAIAQINQIPGVAGVTAISSTPAENGGYRAVQPEGFEMVKDSPTPRANTISAMPGALALFEIPLLSGRYFNASDNQDSDKVAIVSDSFAAKFWPSSGNHDANTFNNAIGKRVKWADDKDQQWYRVIGVVGHVIHGQPFADFKYRTTIYRSNLQQGYGYMTLVAKANPTTHADASRLLKPMLQGIDAVDGSVPAFQVKTIEKVVSRNTAGINFMINLFMIFGLCATVLAGSGIYALMSNAISQRTQELGIRRALGSTDIMVIKMLMKQGIWQLLIGTVMGLPLAFLFSGIILDLIDITDGSIYLVFAAVPLFIATVVLLATYIPAARVVRLEPNVALRYE
ncbi:MAG: putative permease [Phenylobacterium sp.]|jgi:predicted permease